MLGGAFGAILATVAYITLATLLLRPISGGLVLGFQYEYYT